MNCSFVHEGSHPEQPTEASGWGDWMGLRGGSSGWGPKVGQVGGVKRYIGQVGGVER